MHLIRASMRFVSYTDRKAVAAILKPIYTNPDEDAALMALTTFADSNLGKKYPAAVTSWENAWDRFAPFLAFGPALSALGAPLWVVVAGIILASAGSTLWRVIVSS